MVKIIPGERHCHRAHVWRAQEMYRHTERLRTWKLEWLGACRKCSWIDRTPIGAAVGRLENTDTSLIQCDTMDERREIFSLLVSSGRLLSLSTGEVCSEEAVCLLCVQQRVQESQREGWYQPLDSGVHIEEGSVPAKMEHSRFYLAVSTLTVIILWGLFILTFVDTFFF